MIQRYSRPEMRAIWTDENKLKIWLQIELLASEALVKEGVVPAKDFKKIKAGCDKWFADLPGLVARQRELEKTLNHDVIAFTTAVAEVVDAGSTRAPRVADRPAWSEAAATSRAENSRAGALSAVDVASTATAGAAVLPSRWFHFGL